MCQRLFFVISISHFANILGVFLSCGNKLQDFCSIKFNTFLLKCIFREIYSPFQHFAALNSRGILIFEFLRHLIPATFYLKVTKVVPRLSRHFLLENFSSFKVSDESKCQNLCHCLRHYCKLTSFEHISHLVLVFLLLTLSR